MKKNRLPRPQFPSPWIVFTLALLTMLSFRMEAQEQRASYWIGGNTGLYTGGHEIDDALLIGADINFSWKSHLWTIQMNYAPDYVLDEERSEESEYQLYEYSALYGYQRGFAGGKIFLASGISYLDLKRDLPNNGDNGSNSTADDQTSNFGVPVKIGFTANFTNTLGITNAYFVNFNGNKNYFGFQVAFNVGLFQ